MGKIDLKDKKILLQLDSDARMSSSQIGKRVGLSKSVVGYRINRLIKDKIIKNFSTVIDVYKLGFMVMRHHYKYQYTTPDIEKEIIGFFKKTPTSVLVASTQGAFNLKVINIFKNINEFYRIWEQIQEKYGHYFQMKSSALFINEVYYGPSYLLSDELLPQNRAMTILTGCSKKYAVDEIDRELLGILSANARISIVDLADRLNITEQKTKYRMKKLIQAKVIRRFRVNIDISRLGYEIFKSYIYLKQYDMRSKIIDFISQYPQLIFIDKYAAESDLDLEFHVKNIQEFQSIMRDIQNNFSNALRQYEYITITKYHKFLYFPHR